MKLFRKFKQAIGGRILKKEMEPVRLRGGSNFRSAERIGLLYKDLDKETYEGILNYCDFLKRKFDVKTVHFIAYVDSKEKKIPEYQRQTIDAQFFTRQDLNWHMRPVQNVTSFLEQDFDILIDFSGGNVVPLNFLMKESNARMKVGIKGSKAERYCDFMIDMGDQFGMDKYIEQLNLYLSNPRIK
jgi:hypothetical protein